MKRNRKAAAILLLAASALMTGCISGAQADANAPDAALQAPRVKIMMTLSVRQQFQSIMENAALEQCAQYGYSLDVNDANSDMQAQIDQIRMAAAGGYDAIIVNPCSTDAAEAMIAAAGDIPLVFVNNAVDESLLTPGKCVYIGSDEREAGALQGQWIAEHFAGAQEIRYVMLMGALATENTRLRTQSCKDALEEAGFTLHRAFEDTANWDRGQAMDKIQQFIGTDTPFDVVIANNDEMALGAAEAFAGTRFAEIPIVGIDATEAALSAIVNGTMAATVFQDGVGQGAGAVELAHRILQGERVPALTMIPYQLVTIDNIDDFS